MPLVVLCICVTVYVFIAVAIVALYMPSTCQPINCSKLYYHIVSSTNRAILATRFKHEHVAVVLQRCITFH